MVASLYTEGMWGNAIRLINVVTAALVATNYFEPLAKWIEGMSDTFKTYTYLWTSCRSGCCSRCSMIVLRGITDSVCQVKVRFLKMADQIGSVVFACLVAWVMVCFTTFTLHTAPLSKNFLFGGFRRTRTRASCSAGRPTGGGSTSPDPCRGRRIRRATQNPFDRYNQFAKKYEGRRVAIEKHMESTRAIRVR